MQLIADRRYLHRIPELDIDLPETIAYVKEALRGLRCRVFTPAEATVCAFFDFGADSALAFRADMDALPMTETNDVPYASCHPGRMHACGHDGHTAMLLELARQLAKLSSNSKNILLVFQPAEESTGGAWRVCGSGVFEDCHVEAIFGLHLWPGLPAGQIASRAEELMARASEVNVDIYGKSAHIARSWEGIDALAIGTEFYRRAVAMERALPEHIFRLLKFGKMESGQVRNALSAHTHLEGSLRAFQDEIFDDMKEGLYAIGRDLEAEFGCTVKIDINSGYPAVMNPTPLYDRVRQTVEFAELPEPAMTAEDFAFYQRRLPGLFFFLGTGDSPALHTSNFDFDDSLLAVGADFFLRLATTL